MPSGRLAGIIVALLAAVVGCADETNDPDTEGGRAAFAYEMAVRNVLADERHRQAPTTTTSPSTGLPTTGATSTTTTGPSTPSAAPTTDAASNKVPTSVEVDEPVVYIIAADGSAIDPQVQVKVVNQLDNDKVDLRFADDRSETIEADEPGEPVRSGGVLVAAGVVPKEGRLIEFRFERYRSLDDREDVVMSLRRDEETWMVSSTTVVASEQ